MPNGQLELGLSLSNLDELDAGIGSVRARLAEGEPAYDRDSLETAECLQRLGDVLRRANKFDEAARSTRAWRFGVDT